MIPFVRAIAIAAAVSALGLSGLEHTTAAGYPAVQVKIIATVPIGGNSDLVGRLLASHLSTAWTNRSLWTTDLETAAAIAIEKQ